MGHLLVFMIVRSLDKTMRKAWELQLDMQDECSKFRDVENIFEYSNKSFRGGAAWQTEN